MPNQTVTRSAEAEMEPDRLYSVLAEASNIPKWAPVFADAIEPEDNGRYRITKDGESFDVEIVLHPAARAVEYLREMPGGRRGGAYIRAIPRPLGGSTIVMTVPLGPDAIESEVAKVLERELADLIQLAQTSSP